MLYSSFSRYYPPCILGESLFLIEGEEWTMNDIIHYGDYIIDYHKITLFMMMSDKQRHRAFGREEYKLLIGEAERRREGIISDAESSYYCRLGGYENEWLKITGQDKWDDTHIDWRKVWRERRTMEEAEFQSGVKNVIESFGTAADVTSMQHCKNVVHSYIQEYEEKEVFEWVDALILLLHYNSKPKNEENEKKISYYDSIHMTREAKRIMRNLDKRHKELIKFLEKASYQELFEHEHTYQLLTNDSSIGGAFDSIKKLPKITKPEKTVWFAIG